MYSLEQLAPALLALPSVVALTRTSVRAVIGRGAKPFGRPGYCRYFPWLCFP